MQSKTNSSITLKSSINLFLLFLFINILFTNGKINVIDGYTQYLSVKNLLTRGTFAIQGANHKKYPKQYFKGKNGEYYSVFQPGSVIALVPFYISGKIISTVFNKKYREKVMRAVISLYTDVWTSFILLIIYLFTKTYFNNKKTHLILLFLLYYSSIMPYYINVNFNEPLQTLLLLLAVFIVYRKNNLENNNLGTFFLSGVLLGSSVCVRIDTLPAIIVVYFYLSYLSLHQKKIKPVAALSLGVLVMILLLFCYYYQISGKLLVLRSEADTSLTIVPPIPGIYKLLFDSRYGFFIYQPLFFLVAGFAIFNFKKIMQKDFFVFVALLFIANVLFLSFLQNYHGGWNWGPRLLYKTVPFFIICSLLIARNIKKKLLKIACYIFFILSLFINILGLTFGVNGIFRFCVENGFIEHYFHFYIPTISPILGNIYFLGAGVNPQNITINNLRLSNYINIEPLLLQNSAGLIFIIILLLVVIFVLRRKNGIH